MVEQALWQLRGERFPFKGSEQVWLWDPDWWDTVKSLHSTLEPLCALITSLESDAVSLGKAVELVLPELERVPPAYRGGY